jgi:hypothetical protein
VWISEQTAITPLHNTTLLVFVTVVGCVYSAVRAEYLNTFQARLAVSVSEALIKQTFPSTSIPIYGYSKHKQ